MPKWRAQLRDLSFSDASAEPFIGMTSLTRKGDFPDFDTTTHERISLEAYVNGLVNRAKD